MELIPHDYRIVETDPAELKTDAERYLMSMNPKQFIKCTSTENRKHCEIFTHLKVPTLLTNIRTKSTAQRIVITIYFTNGSVKKYPH